jgi:hypothetical protein
MKNLDRYLKIVVWARKRYTTNRMLEIHRGGILSIYSRIEEAAWQKYCA